MRGCLAVLVLGIAFLAVLAWFALVPLAGAAVSVGLLTSGLSGKGTSVVVVASPPYELLTLRADAVEIRSTDASWRGLAAAELAIRLDGVDLGRRSAAAVTGRLGDVSVPLSDGTLPVESITLDGPSSAITATLTVDAATATRTVADAVERAVGTRPSSVALRAPDLVDVTVGTVRAGGRLIVAGGALELLIQPVGRVDIVDPSAGSPLLLTSVAVDDGGPVRLVGRLDPGALGLGR
jgi:hypothetical protein